MLQSHQDNFLGFKGFSRFKCEKRTEVMTHFLTKYFESVQLKVPVDNGDSPALAVRLSSGANPMRVEFHGSHCEYAKAKL